jgi:16S rRNA (guanine(966)-N(2))-methyltransferase RsmD
VRIISGTYKGRHIPVRKNFPSRPTTDFAKESLFNILNNHFDFNSITVLDLFAGTGSISFEFASRGAKVDLIDIDHRSISFIKSTIAALKFTNINAYHTDVFKVISKLDKQYDIIFADPPYQLESLPDLPDLILSTALLKPEGWFILEHSSRHSFNQHSRFRELRRYGSVCFSIFD